MKSATDLLLAFDEIAAMEARLNQKLEAYRKLVRVIRPDFAAAYDRLVSRLKLVQQGGFGPKVGDRMPLFWLTDERGQLLGMQSLLNRGPLILSFNRGHWCPYCKLDLFALAEVYDDVRQCGGDILSIMPDIARFTLPSREMHKLPFSILSDVDLGYSLSMNMVFWVGDDVTSLYKEFGIELEQYHDNRSWYLPIAAKFVIAQSGIVISRHIDVEFRKRADPRLLVDALQKERSR